jgi:hypothetical protein
MIGSLITFWVAVFSAILIAPLLVEMEEHRNLTKLEREVQDAKYQEMAEKANLECTKEFLEEQRKRLSL